MRLSAVLFLFCVSFAASASAQVIEIGDDGEAWTFDGPATFGIDDDRPVAATTLVSNIPNANAFERAAAAHRVDVALLRAVAWTESRGRNSAISPKGAMGIMQLMPGTAAELGVNPRDADSNIAGGAAYLARQISRFRDIPLALAAYNAGPGAVVRWGGIPPYAETRSYVASVMRRWGGKPTPAGLATAVLASTSPATRKAHAGASSRQAEAMLIEVPAL